ncbi:MAG: nucleotidyltransferase family protein [Candidatus Caldarchaeum sp.]
MKIAGCVLAAGFSKRFEGDKLSANIRGLPVLHWSLKCLDHFDFRAVVLRPETTKLFKIPTQIAVLVNTRAERGLSESIKLAVSWTPWEADGLALMLGDMPFTDRIFPRLLDVFRQEKPEAVAAAFKGKPVNPVIFSRKVLHLLYMVEGDVGARNVFSKINIIPVESQEEYLIDVDTEEDLAKAEAIARKLADF